LQDASPKLNVNPYSYASQVETYNQRKKPAVKLCISNPIRKPIEHMSSRNIT